MADLDFGGYLERAARLFPDNVAAVEGGVRTTYAELHRLAASLASGLTKLGIAPGERVVDIRTNSLDSLVFEYGVALTGAVRVPITPRLAASEIAQVMRAIGARAVCTTAEYAHLVDGAEVEFLIADGVPGALSREQVSSEPSLERHHAHGDDLFALRLTGGTTGVPKAARQSHASQVAMSMNALLELADLQADDLLLNTQLLSHGGGLLTLAAAIRGAGLLVQPSFDADAVLNAIESEHVTVIKFVPTILYRLLRAQRARPRDLSSLRLICYGAAPMPEQLLREAMDEFGCDFSQTYGQAEAPGTITCLGPRDHARARSGDSGLLRSVGRPYPFVDVAIVDPEGVELPAGEIGEVTVRGVTMTTGYWNQPEASAELLRGDRVHTRDVGYLSGGYLYLVGRASDMIISGGFNVYPAEVEQVLSAIDGIDTSCVTSVPDQEWGERVVAAVVLQPGSTLTVEQIRTSCRASLAGYKCPKDILIVEEIPLTANGKVSRSVISGLFTKAQR